MYNIVPRRDRANGPTPLNHAWMREGRLFPLLRPAASPSALTW